MLLMGAREGHFCVSMCCGAGCLEALRRFSFIAWISLLLSEPFMVGQGKPGLVRTSLQCLSLLHCGILCYLSYSAGISSGLPYGLHLLPECAYQADRSHNILDMVSSTWQRPPGRQSLGSGSGISSLTFLITTSLEGLRPDDTFEENHFT